MSDRVLNLVFGLYSENHQSDFPVPEQSLQTKQRDYNSLHPLTRYYEGGANEQEMEIMDSLIQTLFSLT